MISCTCCVYRFKLIQCVETPVVTWPFSKTSRRKHHNVVNPRNRVSFPDEELKSQVLRIRRRSELHSVGSFEVACSTIASIHRLPPVPTTRTDHHSYESLRLGAFVEKDSECQGIR